MGDGQKATNEGGRGLRTHNVVVDWLSHWFHVAGIKHKVDRTRSARQTQFSGGAGVTH